MPKTATPKWAVAATWRRYSLHFTKAEAQDALKAWKEEREAEGWRVTGSQSASFMAFGPGHDHQEALRRAKSGEEPLASASASIIKLADHPLCYIGVDANSVRVLREMESAENPAFERYSTRAKALSERWKCVEAV